MSSVRAAFLVIFTATTFLGSSLRQVEAEAPSTTPTPVAVYSKFQDCVDDLKTKGEPNKKNIIECSDSSKEPLWVGAAAFMCTFDYVEGDLRGLDPQTQYHEARHVATTWLCERVTYSNGTNRWALYKYADAEWTYGVRNGTRIYAGRQLPVRALWEKSEIQNFYALCPTTMQVMREHYNGKSGGTVEWTAARPGATEHEPYLYFPKRHTTVSYDYFSPGSENQKKNIGQRPCTYASPYAGQGKSSQQNPSHNREAVEHPNADDNFFDEPLFWKEPPTK